MNPQCVWHVDPAAFVYLKTRLQLPGSQREGWLRCACSGPFQIFLDGEWVGSGPGGELTQVPGWDRFEINTEAASPASILMVRAAAGPEAAWFICEGQISGTSVVTDSTWASLAGTTPDPETAFGEQYSAILEPLHRESESLAWMPCASAEAPTPANLPPAIITTIDLEARELSAFGAFGARRIPSSGRDLLPLTGCKCVHPDGLLQGHGQRATIRTAEAETAVCVVLDFGRQVHGTPYLSLQTEEGGGIIDLFFGSTLDRFDSALRYICCVGRQRWTGLYSHSFRFLLARFSGFVDSDCLVEQLGVRVRRADNEVEDQRRESGAIEGDRQLEALWDVGEPSINACRQQVYRIDAYPAPYDWFTALPLFLNDCSHHGDPTEGLAMLVSTAPPRSASGLRRWLGYPLFVEAYLKYSGDRDTVSGSLGTVTQMLELIQEQRQPSGLLPVQGPWSAARSSIFAAGAVRAATRLFDLFSLKTESRAAGELYYSISNSIQSCWSQKAQLYHEDGDASACTQLTNALVLCFGLADEARQQQILAAIRGPGIETVRGLDEAFYLVAGLWEAKADPRAMQCLQTYWGRLLDREGPTWQDKKSRSTVPGAAPGPDYFLASKVIGVRPAALGHDCLEIDPPSIGISHMAADLPTRHGVVHVEWWRPESQPTCRIEIRTEREARVRLCMPRLGIRFPEVSVNDETVWRNDKVVPNPWVHEIDSESERIVLTVSGRGSFAAHLS